jgi:pSer/pThr/pTyr-binding forkhead associated (FHA) protein
MATRLTLQEMRGGRLQGVKYVLDAPAVCKVGRAEECELRMPGGWEYLDVSRRHCLVEVRPSGVRVRDLGSRNGTFVNGTGVGKRDVRTLCEASPPEMPEYELRDGDELQVGGTVFRVSLSYGVADPDRTPGPADLCGLGPGASGRVADPSLN